MLFGIMPAVMFIHKSSGWRRAVAAAFLELFSMALVFEALQETGLLRIRPEAEHYLPNVSKTGRVDVVGTVSE